MRHLLFLLAAAALIIGCQRATPPVATPVSDAPSTATVALASPTPAPAIAFPDAAQRLDVSVPAAPAEGDPTGRYFMVRVPGAPPDDDSMGTVRLMILDTERGDLWELKRRGVIAPRDFLWTPGSRALWFDDEQASIAAADGSDRQDFPTPEALIELLVTTDRVAIARGASGALHRLDLGGGAWETILPASPQFLYERVLTPNADSIMVLDHQASRIVLVPLAANEPSQEIGPLTPFSHPGSDNPELPVAYALADSPYILTQPIMSEGGDSPIQSVAVNAADGTSQPLGPLMGLDAATTLGDVSPDLRWVAAASLSDEITRMIIAPAAALDQGIATSGWPLAWIASPPGVVIGGSTGDSLFVEYQPLPSGEPVRLLEGMPLASSVEARVGDDYFVVAAEGGVYAFDLAGNPLGSLSLPALEEGPGLVTTRPILWAATSDRVLLVAGTNDDDPTPRLWSWALER